jgi:hypothetical protein
MYAAKNNNIGIAFSGDLAQAEGVAAMVRDILYLAPLVIVGEDDRVTLLAQSVYFPCQFFVLHL